MVSAHLIFLVLAAIFFLLEGIHVQAQRVELGWLGLFFYMLAILSLR